MLPRILASFQLINFNLGYLRTVQHIFTLDSMSPATCDDRIRRTDRRALTNLVLIVRTFKNSWSQRQGRQSHGRGVKMKSDWLLVKPGSNLWLRAAASNLASKSPCIASVSQSHCNPQ